MIAVAVLTLSLAAPLPFPKPVKVVAIYQGVPYSGGMRSETYRIVLHNNGGGMLSRTGRWDAPLKWWRIRGVLRVDDDDPAGDGRMFFEESKLEKLQP